MAFPRLPRAVFRLFVPAILLFLVWRLYGREPARTKEPAIARQTTKESAVEVSSDAKDSATCSAPPEKPDHTFGCQLVTLKQPLRSVVVQGGLNGLTRYKIFLHEPLTDKHISEALWISKGASFLEDDYQEDFFNAIEMTQMATGKENLVIMDLGANIGLHALFFAKLGHTLHAFEPHPPNYRLLQCSGFLNAFDPTKVHFHNVGLTSDPSRRRACIQTPEQDNQGNAVIAQDKKVSVSNGCPKGSTEVALTTLDTFFFSSTGLGSTPVDIIKMDVQGMEHAVLLGGSKMFAKAPPSFIFFEFEPGSIRKQGGDPLEFLRRLRSYGYENGYVMPGSGADDKLRTMSFIGMEEDLAAGKLGGMLDLVVVHSRIGNKGDLWASTRSKLKAAAAAAAAAKVGVVSEPEAAQ